MSHTTAITDIVFVDIAALKLAITDLNKQGVKCDLREKATPRAYSANQQGMGPADYVLHLDNSKYDVGFYMDTQKKGYVAKTDFYGGDIQRLLGVPQPKGAYKPQAMMGKLYQSYGVHATTRAAALKGYSTQKIVKEDGTIQLVLQ